MTEVTQINGHAGRSHAILSPSFMHIALKCSGAVGLKEKLPPELPGEAAIRGTKTHELAEVLLSDWIAHKRTGSDPYIRFELLAANVDAEIVDAARGWREVIWKHCLEGSVTGKVCGVEQRLTYSDELSLWGTCDFWMVATDGKGKRFGIISDLKSGRVLVEESSNPQLAAYAVSLRTEIRNRGKDLDYVRAAIFQPYAEGDKYRETKFSSKQLDAWESKFKKLALEAFSDTPKFKTGDHCRWCRAQAMCTAYAKTLSKETALSFTDAKDFIFPDIETIPEEIRVKVALYEKELAAFARECRKSVLSKMSSGAKIKGIKLVEGSTRRCWNESAESDLIKTLEGFKIEPYEKKLKGIGAVEKELKKVGIKKECKEVLSPFTSRTRPSMLLVRSDDPRPEIESMDAMFNEDDDI